MPRLDVQFGVLPIGHGSPTGSQHFLENEMSENESLGVLFVIFSRRATAQAVYRAAQRAGRT